MAVHTARRSILSEYFCKSQYNLRIQYPMINKLRFIKPLSFIYIHNGNINNVPILILNYVITAPIFAISRTNQYLFLKLSNLTL